MFVCKKCKSRWTDQSFMNSITNCNVANDANKTCKKFTALKLESYRNYQRISPSVSESYLALAVLQLHMNYRVIGNTKDRNTRRKLQYVAADVGHVFSWDL